MKSLTLILLTLCFTLTACPEKKKPAQSKLVRIKGNPMAFVQGRRMTQVPTMRQDQMELNSKYQVNLGGFENVMAASQHAGGPNDPSNGERRLEALADSFYSFRETTSGDLELKPVSGKGLGFRFSRYSGYLELSAVVSGNEIAKAGSAYKVLNYSSTPDGTRHSILIFIEEGRNQTLAAIYIQKAGEGRVNAVRTSEPYNYIYGRGVKVAWPKTETVPVVFCTPEAPQYIYQEFVKAMNEWQSQLHGRLNIRAERDSFCPSFDDVNTRTFGFAPDWVEIPGAQSGVYGWTLTQMNAERSELIDSDVFILSKEIQEAIDYSYRGRSLFDQQERAVPNLKKVIYQVSLHELGHLFGLHHMFDGPDSVMDYENIDYLTEYDRNAIQALYPRLTGDPITARRSTPFLNQ